MSLEGTAGSYQCLVTLSDAANELRNKVKTLWTGLIREMTPENIESILNDSKMRSSDGKLYYYVPTPHYNAAKKLYPSVKVVEYKDPTSINEPGLLSLAWRNDEPLSYAVPGGRFNELYGWDSYFIVKGLLQDGFTDVAQNIVEHQCFQIKYYGKILNANRSYYLGRSQPPFLTDMAWSIYEQTSDSELLIKAIKHAIIEYETVWMSTPRLDHQTGLSRYHPPARHYTVPEEVEEGHFDHILKPLAQSFSLSCSEFVRQYNDSQIHCPELEEFLKHDLAVRESGHDTSTRFDKVCADLATIDLNCLLYKYETDISKAIAAYPHSFDDTPNTWVYRAQQRKEAILKYCWDESSSMFYDYNTKQGSQHKVPSSTSFWVLWAGIAPTEIAAKFVPKALKLLEQPGGLACTAPLQQDHPRQWDYPSGWAPHQIMAWEGLNKYGYREESQRLSEKWLQTVVRNYGSEGLVYEKYNVVDCTHGVDAEYGNQGTFSEGFGWTNASVALAWANREQK